MTRGTYLYGVVARRPGTPSTTGSRKGRAAAGADEWKKLKGVGDGPAPVRRVEHGDVAAVVSDVDADAIGEAAGVRALRRDMAAHAEVLNGVFARRTVLPSRFGLVFPDDRALVDRFLAPRHDLLVDLLAQLDGAVELSFSADYVEEAVLAEVVRENPRLGGAPGASYQERIDAGRRLAAAIRAKRERDGQWLVERLSPLARDVVVAEGRSDLSVARASFLVPRGDVAKFDAALERLAKEAGDVMRLNCVGPLPPYSFADVRVPAEA
jgi:hypothetical protein